MDLPTTSYSPAVLNGYYVEEDQTQMDGFYRFENKPAFLLTDGLYCVIVDCYLEDGSIYSQVLKVRPLRVTFSE